MSDNSLTITFKAKPRVVCEQRRVQIPKITRSHCNMHAFRTCKKFGAYANSDLFLAMLARQLRFLNLEIGKEIIIDSPPENVTVDASGFLAVVTITIPVDDVKRWW